MAATASPPEPELGSSDKEVIEELKAAHAAMKQQLELVIVGQEEVIEQLLISIFCRSHALLVGVPGLAKTLLVSTLSEVLDLSFKRIQFTPDLMPADITGTEVLEEDHGTGKRIFKFVKGPVFANMILADEINRTPPKTQAALLEAMQEHHVTIGEETIPFRAFVSPQNLIEQEGTYPLPEACWTVSCHDPRELPHRRRGRIYHQARHRDLPSPDRETTHRRNRSKTAGRRPTSACC